MSGSGGACAVEQAAVCLGRLRPAPWTRVQRIRGLAPRTPKEGESGVFSAREGQALLALVRFSIDSGGQHMSELFDYYMEFLQALPEMTLVNETKLREDGEVKQGFVCRYVTLLAELAASPAVDEEYVRSVEGCIQGVLLRLADAIARATPDSLPQASLREWLIQAVPTFLGVCEAMSLSSMSPSASLLEALWTSTLVRQLSQCVECLNTLAGIAQLAPLTPPAGLTASRQSLHTDTALNTQSGGKQQPGSVYWQGIGYKVLLAILSVLRRFFVKLQTLSQNNNAEGVAQSTEVISKQLLEDFEGNAHAYARGIYQAMYAKLFGSDDTPATPLEPSEQSVVLSILVASIDLLVLSSSQIMTSTTALGSTSSLAHIHTTSSILFHQLEVEEREVSVDLVPLYLVCVEGLAVLAERSRELREREKGKDSTSITKDDSIIVSSHLQLLRDMLVRPSPIFLRLARDAYVTSATSYPAAVSGRNALDTFRSACASAVARLVICDSERRGESCLPFVTSLNASMVLATTVEDQGSEGNNNNHVHVGDVIVENVLECLVQIAVRLRERDSQAVKHTVTMLYQRLFFPPSALDTVIIRHLGYLATATPRANFKAVVDIFVQILGRVLSPPSQNGADDSSMLDDGVDKYTHIIQHSAVENALMCMVDKLEEEAYKVELLEKLLMLFKRLAPLYLSLPEPSSTASSSSAALLASPLSLSSVSSLPASRRIGVLLPVMGKVATQVQSRATSDVMELYRYFWMYATMLKFVGPSALKTLPVEWQEAMAQIASSSQPLVDKRRVGYLADELQATSIMWKKNMSSKDVSQYQELLCQVVLASSQLGSEIRSLGVAQAVYILSVYSLESLRVLAQQGAPLLPSPFLTVFSYLEDKSIQQPGMLGPFRAIVNKLFTLYLESLQRMRGTHDRERALEDLALFLLVRFNHHTQAVKEAADQYLSQLVDKFPQLLWSERVIVNMLNLLDALSKAISIEEVDIFEKVPLPFFPNEVVVSDKLETRKAVLRDFSAQCSEFVRQAMVFATSETSLNLEKYISSLRGSMSTEAGAGLQIALSFTSRHEADVAAPPPRISIVPGEAEIRKGGSANSAASAGSFRSSMIGPVLVQRNFYEGQLRGYLLTAGSIRKSSQSSGAYAAHNDSLLQAWAASIATRLRGLSTCLIEQSNVATADINIPLEVFQACHFDHVAFDQHDGVVTVPRIAALEAFEEALFQAAAVIVSEDGSGGAVDRRVLLNAVVWAPVRVFSTRALSTAIRCWQWISSKPVFETTLLGIIEAAWTWTANSKLGLFSDNHGHDQGPEAIQGPPDATKPVVEPHALWLKFLIERLHVVKRRNYDQLHLILSMAHTALIRPEDLCRHSAAVEARYLLFTLAMKILQADFVPNPTELRLRVLDAILQSFACPPRWPTVSNVTSEIEVMIGLWMLLQSDKRRCKDLDKASKRPEISKPSKGSSASSTIGATVTVPHLSFQRRHNLALILVRHEIERYTIWYNPDARPERMVKDEETVRKSTNPSPIPTDRSWSEYARLAWQINPKLAIQLAYRHKGSEFLWKEVSNLVAKNPSAVSDVPEALEFLITKPRLDEMAPEIYHALTWAPVAPITALQLLRNFSGHPVTSLYAVRVLHSFAPDVILFAIPQIIQVLRFDNRGYVRKYILEAAANSQLLAHQFIWNMKTNTFTDDEAKHRDSVLADVLESIIEDILKNLSGRALAFYNREFDFFNKVTAISGTIRDKPLGPERKAACQEELSKIKVVPGCYLPSNPTSMVLGIDYSSGIPMQSAAKAPFLATFYVKKCNLEDLEFFDESAEGAHDTMNMELSRAVKQSCIFKVGDDVRQDMLALQVIELCKQVFIELELPVFLFPYRVVATSPGCGVIECVPNATSRDQMGRKTNATLYEYFVKVYGDEDTIEFQKARRNFIRSMAAYSVVGFLLQVKDRHNGNIMIDTEGHIIHIDFGFLFESSPGGNVGFEPDLKLTTEMVKIMGGDWNSEPFRWFIDLCVRAYLAVRPFTEQICSLVSLMRNTGLPCFRTNKTLDLLRARFLPDKTDREAAAHMRQRISDSYLSFRSHAYDVFQYHSNAIPY